MVAWDFPAVVKRQTSAVSCTVMGRLTVDQELQRFRSKLVVVGAIYAFDAACIVVFGVMLRWI